MCAGSGGEAKLSHVSVLPGVKRPTVMFHQKSSRRVISKVRFLSFSNGIFFLPKNILPRI